MIEKRAALIPIGKAGESHFFFTCCNALSTRFIPMVISKSAGGVPSEVSLIGQKAQEKPIQVLPN